MKKTVSVKTIIFILAACMLAMLSSCTRGNPVDSRNDSQSAEKFGKVAVSIDGAGMKKSPAVRTVNPSLANDPFNGFKMVYEFAKVTGGVVSGTWTAQEADADGLFTLAYGDWQVKVSAYANAADTDPVAVGTSATFTVGAANTSATVTLNAAAGATNGTGTFKYYVTYPDGATVTSLSLVNMFDDDADPIDITPLTGTSNGTTATLSGTKTNVPGGYYFLTIQLTKDGVTTGGNEVVYIYNSMTSEYGTADAPVTFTIEYFIDHTAPALSDGHAHRKSDVAAIIGFTTDEAGTARYLVVAKDANAPTKEAVNAGSSLGAVRIGANSGLDVALTAGAKDIYVVVQDFAGNISAAIKITVAASATVIATYTDEEDGTVYELKIYDDDGDSNGDTYVLTVTDPDGDKHISTGRITDDDGNGTLTLTPDGNNGGNNPPFTVTVDDKDDRITDIDGDITFDDGSTKVIPPDVTDTYEGKDGDDNHYKLDIKDDDTYELTVTEEDGDEHVSTGTVEDNGDGTLTLTPDKDPDSPFIVKVDDDGNITDIDGDITFDDGSTKTGPGDITMFNPTVTWPTGLTATYGQTLANVSLPGNVGGTAGSFSWTYGNTTSVGNAGTHQHNLTFTPSDAKYHEVQHHVDVTVSPKHVTVTGITSANKVYDGTAAAAVNTTAAVISGILGNDVVTVVAGTAAFANKNVGTNKIVTFSGFTLGGAAGGNYSLTAQPENKNANITAKPLTVATATHTKTYDGNTTASGVTVTLSGIVDGDAVSAGTVTAAYTASAIGTTTLNITNVALSGADAGNYSVTLPTSALTVAGITTPTGKSGITYYWADDGDGVSIGDNVGDPLPSNRVSVAQGSTMTFTAGESYDAYRWTFNSATVGSTESYTFDATGRHAGSEWNIGLMIKNGNNYHYTQITVVITAN